MLFLGAAPIGHVPFMTQKLVIAFYELYANQRRILWGTVSPAQEKRPGPGLSKSPRWTPPLKKKTRIGRTGFGIPCTGQHNRSGLAFNKEQFFTICMLFTDLVIGN